MKMIPKMILHQCHHLLVSAEQMVRGIVFSSSASWCVNNYRMDRVLLLKLCDLIKNSTAIRDEVDEFTVGNAVTNGTF
jgi:hypothetical protein